MKRKVVMDIIKGLLAGCLFAVGATYIWKLEVPIGFVVFAISFLLAFWILKGIDK
jgi:hypothetical protein